MLTHPLLISSSRQKAPFFRSGGSCRAGLYSATLLFVAPFDSFRLVLAPVAMFRPMLARRTNPLLWLLLAGWIVLAAGCVQRRITIRSNPPGALVYVDNHAIGTTPVSHEFTYYRTGQIRLVKDGYETLTVLQPIRTPWYQWFGLDFVSENVIPWEIRDERVYSYQMVPQRIVPVEEFLARGENLRATAISAPRSGPLPSIPPAAPPVILPARPATPLPFTGPPLAAPPTTRPWPTPRRAWPTP